MTNKFIRTTLAFVFSLSALPRSSWAQAPPLSDDNATALLGKSLAATNLKSPGKQPFHLTATVKYKADGPALTGRFEILFSPPDRYRMNLTIGKISETQVASGDKLYISRPSQKFSAEAWRIADFLWSPGAGLQTPPKVIVGRATSYPTVKVAGNCEEESDALRVRKACFDPSQGITSFAIQDQKGSSLTEDAVSLSDFHSLGAIATPATSQRSPHGTRLTQQLILLPLKARWMKAPSLRRQIPSRAIGVPRRKQSLARRLPIAL